MPSNTAPDSIAMCMSKVLQSWSWYTEGKVQMSKKHGYRRHTNTGKEDTESKKNYTAPAILHRHFTARLKLTSSGARDLPRRVGVHHPIAPLQAAAELPVGGLEESRLGHAPTMSRRMAEVVEKASRIRAQAA